MISCLVNFLTISTPFLTCFFDLGFLPAPFEPIFEKVHEALRGIQDGENINCSHNEEPALGIGTDEVLEEYDDTRSKSPDLSRSLAPPR
jgi:hypothetical protein